MKKSMHQNKLVNETILFVKQKLAGAEGGHDWFHIERVWKLAKLIAGNEKVDPLVVELAALLHDIADAKFFNGDENIGPQEARLFLERLQVDGEIVNHVEKIIRHISFKGGSADASFSSPELMVVQDADRLDALGAIGIARAFNYGGFKNRKLYDPAIKPSPGMSREAYKNSDAPTINHFYEKLLLLKERINTATGQALAIQRHAFLEHYLEQFFAEWEGQR